MWGSTRPNTADECTWENAPFNGGNSEYNADAFNSVKDTACPNDVLAKDYDAAAQIMGGDWRMPTDTEIQELLKNTKHEWVTNYNGTGVNGRKFTASNGNSIFIPAAGRCNDGSVYGVGGSGDVWSSSLYTSDPSNAWYLYFSSGNCFMYYDYRCYGQSVRGVRK